MNLNQNVPRAGLVPWSMKIFGSKGSNGVDKEFSTELLIATKKALGDNSLLVMAEAIATRVAQSAVPSTTFQRVTMGKKLKKKQQKNSHTDFMTVEFDKVGSRVVAGALGGAALDVVATFTKSASYGPKGQLKYRGMFDRKELTTNTEFQVDIPNDYDKTDFNDMITDIIGILNAAECMLILPATKGKDWDTEWRTVTQWNFVGVRQKQLRNRRKSTAQKERELSNEKINDVENLVETMINNAEGALTLLQLATAIIPQISALAKVYGVAVVLAKIVGNSLPQQAMREAIKMLPA